jgi:uncharacterized protein YndB with AHSA1/START domain
MTNRKMNVETKGSTLILTRIFDAPCELVFETYSSCEHLKNWWGPRSWPISYCEIDFRVGGEWHYCMSGPNEGDESWGKVIYKEINPPERLVYTDYFSDKDGNINDDMPSTLSTYHFKDDNGKTKLVCNAEYSSPENLKKVLDMGMIEGMTETLDRLDEHLESIQN